MSEAANPTTRLQACLYAPSAVTIRVTKDPAGVPVTSDLAIAAGTLYQSHDAFLTAWTTQMVADLGAGWSAAVGSISLGLGYTIITGTANMSVNWSFAGAGGTIRDWLGFAANITNQASPQTSPGATAGAFYCTQAAQVLQRTRTTRPRAQMMTLAAATRTQHHTSPSDVDDVDLDVELRFGTVTPHVEQQNFVTFGAGLDTYSSEGQFTLKHGDTSYFVAFAGDDLLRFRFERVESNNDTLWRMAFTARLVGAST